MTRVSNTLRAARKAHTIWQILDTRADIIRPSVKRPVPCMVVAASGYCHCTGALLRAFAFRCAAAAYVVCCVWIMFHFAGLVPPTGPVSGRVCLRLFPLPVVPPATFPCWVAFFAFAEAVRLFCVVVHGIGHQQQINCWMLALMIGNVDTNLIICPMFQFCF